MAIQKLSELVISQIAAGEVVERPASVVKELLENSLDARANNIIIEIQDGGRRLIRVSDDGTGIPSPEITLAIARHATSKLTSADDLYAIQTLGFRGEALASITAVSRLTLTTRHRSEQMGMELWAEGGEIRSQKSVGVPAGTVVTVENLFFNTPARLKFLKSDNTEKRLISNIVNDYAMAYPKKRFVLIQDGREVFRSNGTGNLADVVAKVFGLEVFRKMIEVYGQEPIQNIGENIEVQGFVSLPEMHRNDRSRIVLFVNGRAVQDSGLVYGITQAYHMLIEKGRYPYAVLLVNVPSDFVDVNVHPAKAEVRFQDPNITFVAVQRSVRDVLLRNARLYHREASSDSYTPTEVDTSASSDNPQLDMGFQVASVSQSRPNLPTEEGDFSYIPDGTNRPAKPRTLPPLRVVGQINAMYIVAEGPAGLYLVDQYAASETVLLDTLTDEFDQLPEQIQTIDPVTVDTTAQQARLLEGRLEELQRVAIVLEQFGNASFRVRAIPRVVAPRDAHELIGRIVIGLEQRDEFPMGYLLRIAQVGAHKGGQALTQEQMQTIIRKLERCPDPLKSPSGRATLLHLSAEQLAREFNKR
jgi:DNA mismatch repair protein MutL